MSVLEVAVFAMVLTNTVAPFDCWMEADQSVVCTNDLVAQEIGHGRIRFSNGVTVHQDAGGALWFDNGIDTHMDSTGWIQFSNGQSARRDREGNIVFGSGMICRPEGSFVVNCTRD